MMTIFKCFMSKTACLLCPITDLAFSPMRPGPGAELPALLALYFTLRVMIDWPQMTIAHTRSIWYPLQKYKFSIYDFDLFTKKKGSSAKGEHWEAKTVETIPENNLIADQFWNDVTLSFGRYITMPAGLNPIYGRHRSLFFMTGGI